jgi:hypothetical protein
VRRSHCVRLATVGVSRTRGSPTAWPPFVSYARPTSSTTPPIHGGRAMTIR